MLDAPSMFDSLWDEARSPWAKQGAETAEAWPKPVPAFSTARATSQFSSSSPSSFLSNLRRPTQPATSQLASFKFNPSAEPFAPSRSPITTGNTTSSSADPSILLAFPPNEHSPPPPAVNWAESGKYSDT